MQPATKADVEKAVGELAAMTGGEFRYIREEMATMATKELVRELAENTQEEFRAVRREMSEGFRAVLAAIESVEYTKLRMRIDVLESDVGRIKEKVKV